MKNLVKLLSLGLLVLGLANCGSDGGSPAPAPVSGAAEEANEMQFDDGQNTSIIWSESVGNVYYPTTESCYYGLGENADDPKVDQFYSELSGLVNNSTIGKGSKSSASNQSIYLSIRYQGGEVRTFNLTTELASSSEETLSNGSKIIELFNNVNTEIESNGYRGCTNGKGTNYK